MSSTRCTGISERNVWIARVCTLARIHWFCIDGDADPVKSDLADSYYNNTEVMEGGVPVFAIEVDAIPTGARRLARTPVLDSAMVRVNRQI